MNLVRRINLLAMALATVLVIGCHHQNRGGLPARPSDDGFPVTIVDAQGEDVTVATRPARIVSTSPTVTEMLFALGAGDRVVAVTEQCDYPPEAVGLPRIGGFWTPSVEKVLGVNPDLVIAQRGNPPDFVKVLRKSGVPVFTIDPQTMDGIFQSMRQTARLIGKKEAGSALIGDMEARLAAVKKRVESVPERERKTAFMVLQVTPLWTAGSGTFLDDAMQAAGARNIAHEVSGWRAFGTESLLVANPDFIVASTMAGDPERMRTEIVSNPVLKRLTAVKEESVLLLEADPLMRAGPRIVEAVETMAQAFYPDQFRDD
ncbi:MAG: ABC transporter substrate-binding protein [Armatimonadetes bacterium]|nr:ABC transporter substrate-binding protein [Armatimonadota bacterium]